MQEGEKQMEFQYLRNLNKTFAIKLRFIYFLLLPHFNYKSLLLRSIIVEAGTSKPITKYVGRFN